MLPVGLHGDVGQVSHKHWLYVLSWNNLLRFIFTVIRKAQLTSATWDVMWNIFTWRMAVLLAGEPPSEDLAGRSWTRLWHWWRGVLVQLTGDWPFHCGVLNFLKHKENENMCRLCKASTVTRDLLHTDATSKAG